LLVCSEDQGGMNFQYLKPSTAKVVTTCTFYATNWVRELLSIFVHNAAFPNLLMTNPSSQQSQYAVDTQEKVIDRIGTLVTLEEELAFQAGNCDSFFPPGYEDGERLEFGGKKKSRAGLRQAFDDEPDYEDMSKEEAKAAKAKFNKLKKAREAEIKKEKSEADKMMTKQKKEDEKVKGLLVERCTKALRPLSHEVVLALGFPSLSNERGGDREGSQDLSEMRIGDPVVKLLLMQLHESLKDVSMEGGAVVRFNVGRPKKESEEGGSTNDADEENNPYNTVAGGDQAISASKLHTRLGLYLHGGVFSSVHHHLALLIEVRAEKRRSKAAGEADDDDDDQNSYSTDDDNLLECISTVFDTIGIVMNSEALTSSKEDKKVS
jgi:hypothetical protein